MLGCLDDLKDLNFKIKYFNTFSDLSYAVVSYRNISHANFISLESGSLAHKPPHPKVRPSLLFPFLIDS